MTIDAVLVEAGEGRGFEKGKIDNDDEGEDDNDPTDGLKNSLDLGRAAL